MDEKKMYARGLSHVLFYSVNYKLLWHLSRFKLFRSPFIPGVIKIDFICVNKFPKVEQKPIFMA